MPCWRSLTPADALPLPASPHPVPYRGRGRAGVGTYTRTSGAYTYTRGAYEHQDGEGSHGVGADRCSTTARLKAIGQEAQARVYRVAEARRPARRNKPTGRAALLALVLCALVVALAYPTRESIAQRGEIADQRRAAEAAKKQVEQLREEKARWQDPEYV